jgi:RHS repeat-associated protein
VLVKQVDYVYDPFNQLVKRVVDSDGDQSSSPTAVDQTFFLYDQGQVVLEFEKNGTGNVAAGDLSHRYLWNPAAVDQLFADEQLGDDTYWMMSDNLGSIRDVLDSAVNLRIHRDFDSFGNVIDETHYNGNIDEAFGFTGRLFDDETGLQNNLNRWYDPATGRWISEDPIGFAAGDANLNRYVGNESTRYIDPSGLAPGGYGIPWAAGYGENSESWYDRQQKLRKAGWQFPPIPKLPTDPPSPEWNWDGPGAPGSGLGEWVGPNGERLHNDLNHPPGKRPHWRVRYPGGNEWEYFPHTGKWVPSPNNKPNRPGFNPSPYVKRIAVGLTAGALIYINYNFGRIANSISATEPCTCTLVPTSL